MISLLRAITLGNACLLVCLSLVLGAEPLHACPALVSLTEASPALADSFQYSACSCEPNACAEASPAFADSLSQPAGAFPICMMAAGERTATANLGLRPLSQQILSSLPIIAIGAGYNVHNQSLRSIRMSHTPSFRHHYDDYMQFAPLATQGILRLSGLQGQSQSSLQMLTADALATATMFAVVTGGKYLFRVERPDGSSRNSYPSGHTAMAFTSATLLHIEYGHRYPWLSMLGYASATSVGIGRVLNNRHWAGDVVTGVGIGLLSGYLGYYLSARLFGSQQSWSWLDDRHHKCSPWSLSLSMYHGLRGRSFVTADQRAQVSLSASSLTLGLRRRLGTHYYLQAELMPEVYRLRAHLEGIAQPRHGRISSFAYSLGAGYSTAIGGDKSPLTAHLGLSLVYRHSRERELPQGVNLELRPSLSPRLSLELDYRLSAHLFLRGTLAYQHTQDDFRASSTQGQGSTHSPRWLMGTSFVYAL